MRFDTVLIGGGLSSLVCGILLQPYPCLVLQNGQRLSEGAEVGGYKIVSIAPDRIRVRRDEEEEIEWTP